MEQERPTTRPALERGFELAELLVCLLLVGVGLTSLVMVVASSDEGGPGAGEEVMGLLSSTAENEKPPGEILIAGAGLESVLVDGLAWSKRSEGLDGERVRLVPNDASPELSGGQYWVVGLSGKLPERPAIYDAERLGEADGLVLERWQSSGPVAYRLLDSLVSASAAFVSTKNGDERPCERARFGKQGRLHCGPHPWNWVGPTQVPVKDEQVWCIWSHPLRGHELRIEFPDVPLGDAVLEGRYALTDFAADTAGGSPVTFKVLVDGEEAINRLTPNRRGWHRYRVTPRKDAKAGDSAEVTFVITSPNDGRRHFCFDGEIKGGGG